MAITSITIENFKGIGDAVTIPIRPITLLFGKNSSGKSTVLQALLYMLNVIRYNTPDPYHLEQLGMDADLMNLGCFHKFVHRHELERKIRIRVEFDVEIPPAQPGWIEIKTGWNSEKDAPYIGSQMIGVGDEKWEYNEHKKEGRNNLEKNLVYRSVYLSCGKELQDFCYLGPIRKELPRDLNEIHYALLADEDEFKKRNYSNWANGLAAWATLLRDQLLRDQLLIDKTNDLMRNLVLGYKIIVEKKDIASLDVNGEIVAKLIEASKNGKDQVRALLRRYSRRTLQFHLRDENQIDLDPADVGTGISQVIPVLVGALEDSYRLFAVEQPELHVHPAVQVGLGDVFIDAIKNSDRTMLIETHSEHLLLRLLRRVRETNVRNSKKYEWRQSSMTPLVRETSEATIRDSEDQDSQDHQLTPDDLSVVYVRPTPEGIKFTPISVTDDGDFYAPWPEGFFDERVEELF